MTDEKKPKLELVPDAVPEPEPDAESAELDAAPSVRCGLVLYYTSEGETGAKDMNDSGGADRQIQDDEAMELLQGALENIRMSRAVRATLEHLQEMRMRHQAPKAGAIIAPDGQEISSADFIQTSPDVGNTDGGEPTGE